MIERIRQFWRAINASLDEDDYKYIRSKLTADEQKLFFAMRVYDQRHVLNVVHTALKLSEQYSNVNIDLLEKACLLHDVGRTAKDICLMDKVLAVLLNKFMPSIAKALAKRNGNEHKSLGQKRRHALFIYYNHAQIGAAKLNAIGLTEVANIIKYHHAQARKDDCIELKLLKQADSLN